MDIEFRVCPDCKGYGVLDNGNNCVTCGGCGKGGLLGGGDIGSGEIMIDRATGRQITVADLIKAQKVISDSCTTKIFLVS